MKVHRRGLKNLALACCQQWIDDGRPRVSQETVETYAQLAKQLLSEEVPKPTKLGRLMKEGRVIVI